MLYSGLKARVRDLLEGNNMKDVERTHSPTYASKLH